MIGVYEERPPEGSGISAHPVDETVINHDFLNRELLKTAKAATRIKDWLHSLIGT